MIERTPLQLAIHQLAVSNVDEMERALRRCNSFYEREQCRQAYHIRYKALEDMTCQAHGMPGALYKAR